MLAALVAMSGLAATAATFTVTNSTDDINGDVSTPAALIASPGSDGISLREAVQAANAAPGPHEIVFDSSLAGSVIHLKDEPLQLARSGMALVGFSGPDGTPAVTIDGSGVPAIRGAAIYVTASRMRIARLRLVGVSENGLEVTAGWGQPVPPPGWIAPSAVIEDVRIEENVFDNTGAPFSPFLTAIRVWLHPSTTQTARISRVAIRRNKVVGYTQINDAGFIVSPSGKASVIEDVSIEENEFHATFPLEVSYISGVDCVARRTTIARNRVVDATVAALIGTIGTRNRENSGNVIEETVFDSNEFRGNLDSIALTSFTADVDASIRNSITRDTTFRNNLIATGRGLVFTAGQGDVSGNRIESVLVVNNTIVTGPLAAVSAVSNAEGATGNAITGLEIHNTIISGPIKNQTGPVDEIEGEITPMQVFNSLVTLERFGGVNGNIVGDARFADRAAGDFHLRSTSPAIGAAGAARAPAVDLDCRARVGSPDIGAWEHGAVDRPRLTLLVDGEGRGAVVTTPAGLRCGGTRTSSFDPGATVLLTPVPASRFERWSNDEDCSDGAVTMNEDRTCTAHFRLPGRRRAVAH